MSFAHHLEGYQLTTAEITYRRPDHPSLLQEFIWQQLDLVPQFPKLHEFLRFWEAELDGALYSVRVSAAELMKPTDFRWTESSLRIH
jgi:uncharacterized protein Usg